MPAADGLRAVEDLEQGRKRKERHRERDHPGIGRIA